MELFDFLQAQMHTAYRELADQQRLESESTLIKSYIFEVDLPTRLLAANAGGRGLDTFIRSLVQPADEKTSHVVVQSKKEEGFFEIRYRTHEADLVVYLDAGTDSRFWECFSISKSRYLDTWFHSMAMRKPEFDFVWLWPGFLKDIQKRGSPRGFGLDYDRRKFGDGDTEETTTYLKMQIWGGSETDQLYDSLSHSQQFGNKIVLSKVRMKESAENGNNEEFAVQDVKYTGKFTARGSSFETHRRTLNFVRETYAKKVTDIEEGYRLRWREGKKGEVHMEGFALHFIPESFEIPVNRFCEALFSGTMPFRLLGFVDFLTDKSAVVDAVDMHTGGKLSFEVYPDVLSAYLPDGTCGNTILRLYTNIQHYFDKRFSVEADNGEKLF
ncbi:MAG: hypothetical protein A2Y63_04150 [Candidatus Riflebacteria bacterium RBG_13_59_9]|nr:MAG: hypothetical protein A2Y63_04150 [Candidatus Riflebacteria bacterium RBG_13_59_9]